MIDRVKEIVEQSGLDQQRLSVKSGVPIERLQQILQGQDPTLGELRKIAATLNISLTDFTESTPVQREADLLFRRASRHGDSVQQWTISSLSRQMANSLDLLRVRHSDEAPWIGYFENKERNYEGAERNAAIFRRVFCSDDQLGPLYSLPKIVVSRMEALLFVIRSSEIDGASAYFEGVPFIFVSARFPGRMLFTLAHELGHLVVSRSVSKTYAAIDENIEHEKANVSDEEFYADAFASSLLMPRAGVGIVLKKIRELLKKSEDSVGDIEISYLARIFGVSFWAAARRCEDLKLLPTGGAASLNEKLKKEFGSAEKRAEEVGLPPRPKIEFPSIPEPLLRRVVSRIKEGEISIGKAAASLGISIGDILSANTPTAH